LKAIQQDLLKYTATLGSGVSGDEGPDGVNETETFILYVGASVHSFKEEV
jgi:hypothetical protein